MSIAIDGDEAVFIPRVNYFGNGGFAYSVSDGKGGVQARWIETS